MKRYLNFTEQLTYRGASFPIFSFKLKLTNHQLDKDNIYKAYQAVARKHPLLRVNIFQDEQHRPFFKEIENYMPNIALTQAESDGYFIPKGLLEEKVEHGVDKGMVRIGISTWKDEAILFLELCHSIMEKRSIVLLADELIKYYVKFAQENYDPSDPENLPYDFPLSPLNPLEPSDEQKLKLAELMQRKKEARENYKHIFPKAGETSEKFIRQNIRGSVKKYSQLKAFASEHKISPYSLIFASSIVSIALMARDYNTNQGKDEISITSLIPVDKTHQLYPEFLNKIVLNIDLTDFNCKLNYSSSLLETTDYLRKEWREEGKYYGCFFSNMIGYASLKGEMPPFDNYINIVPCEPKTEELRINDSQKIEFGDTFNLDERKYKFESIDLNPRIQCFALKDRIDYHYYFTENNEKLSRELMNYFKEITENFSKYANQKISDIRI
mmetsp:Transcript_21431/g.22254  ORF Transcript_21431/g.22254 Transcript_21431/m.22254 type:complete len:441 (+) Transcript_21431:16-1338(+)